MGKSARFHFCFCMDFRIKWTLSYNGHHMLMSGHTFLTDVSQVWGSLDQETRKMKEKRINILKLLLIFLVGNDILVSYDYKRSNGSHEHGLLHEGG